MSGQRVDVGEAGDPAVGGELEDVGASLRLWRRPTLAGPSDRQPTGEQPGFARSPDAKAWQGFVGGADQRAERGRSDDAVGNLVVAIDAVRRPALRQELVGFLGLVPRPLIELVRVLGSKHPALLRSKARPELYDEGLPTLSRGGSVAAGPARDRSSSRRIPVLRTYTRSMNREPACR